ncbi:MAG TPA: M20 family metallopeptidase [Ktedonobacteraceae bacterium]|nr:M20 family metallopeptidase [Ktedonobacteraceae bacterium]
MSKHFRIDQAEKIFDRYLEDLKTIVNIDSGSYTKVGIDNVVNYLQKRFEDFGFTTRIEPVSDYGNHLVATRQGSNPNGPRILLIGHLDTVLADGEASRRPFTIKERDGMRVASGPGVLDMKSGVLIGLYASHLLFESNETDFQNITFLCNSDEEIGSPSSTPLVKKLASEADAVLVLEPGRARHTVLASRRGVAKYTLEVHGLSAHAGVAPKSGRNAILEMSYQVQAMQALNDTIPGTTLNVGLIKGGERSNIVPDYAWCEIDVRASTVEGFEKIQAAMQKVASHTVIDGTTIRLNGSVWHQPFEPNEQHTRLLNLTKLAGQELGIQIEGVPSGGGSDANTTAAMGIATIDGMGAGGDHAHNPEEYIELDYLPDRIALVSGLIQQIGQYYQQGNKL